MTSSSSSSAVSQHVTTFVRHKPLFDDDENGDEKRNEGRIAGKSFGIVGLKPAHSRTKATLHLLSDWEGRDALLQLAQSISLLVYSMAPIRRRQLHIASESMANVRKVLVLARWISTGSEAVHRAWFAKEGKEDDDDDGVSASGEGSDDDQEGNEELARIQRDAQRFWSYIWQRRIGYASECMVMLGEGCELVALLGGSSVLWRIIGGKLAARQRKGLERIALVFLALGFALGLRSLALMRKARLDKLRSAHRRLLVATDNLNAEADANTIFGARHLSTEQALSLHHRSDVKEKAVVHEKASESKGQRELRKAEKAVFLQRQKVQLLRLERTSMRAELLFVLAELFWPLHDHTRLEGWTTLIAAVCHTSRLTKESRWHR